MPKANKRLTRMESHDAAGYETDYQDFSDFDDGYGNNVDVGDKSVQRMVERGYREPWHTTVPGEEGFSTAKSPEGYDKHPFQSKAQARKFRAMESRGEIPKGTSSRWMHKTKNYSSLPEKKG